MFSYSINEQNFIVKRYLFICGNICSTITFLCFINQYCMYKVQSLISNYNIKKRQLIIKFQKTKELCRSFKTSFNIWQHTNCIHIRNQKAKEILIFFLSGLVLFEKCDMAIFVWKGSSCCTEACVRSGHHSELKWTGSSTHCLWNSSSTAALLVLKLAVWVVRVTHQTCTEERGRQRKWRENENTETHGGPWCAVFFCLDFLLFPWITEVGVSRVDNTGPRTFTIKWKIHLRHSYIVDISAVHSWNAWICPIQTFPRFISCFHLQPSTGIKANKKKS